MRNPQTRRGLTIIEVLVVLLITAIVVAVVYPVLRRSRCGGASLKDKTQITQIHKAMLAFAAGNAGSLPTPGWIQKKQPANSGALEHDFLLNHSAPLYSFLVGANMVKPELLVSPDCINETTAVWVKSDYNYSAYNPSTSRYWDPTFSMRIDSPKIGANCSYAHMAICGDRRDTKWRNNQDGGTPIIGTRGTRNGATSGLDFERSPTLKLHLPKDQWVGHVCFADNHAETLDSFFPPLVRFLDAGGSLVKDNIFAAEFAHSRGNQAADDAFLGVSVGSTEFAVDIVYDPLE